MVSQTETDKLSKHVKLEEMIEKGFQKVPKDILGMELDELRKQLVATAMSYKSEKLRN